MIPKSQSICDHKTASHWFDQDAVDGSRRGIRVNAILPGAINTPMLWENPNIKMGIEVLNKEDIGKPEDIAAAILYLASDESSFIQGANLLVDGGRLARL